MISIQAVTLLLVRPLTTNIDTFTGTTFNDTFNASLGGASVNVNTLNTLDSLNGAGGIDTLNAQIHTSVTPTALTNIELINVTADAAVTLGLANAGQLTNVTNNTSTGVLTVSGIVEGASIAVNSVGDASGAAGSDAIFNFDSAAAADVNLTVTNVTATARAVEVEINNTSGTVNLTSSGSSNKVALTDNSDDITTVNVDGSGAITLTAAAATVVDASDLTGVLTFTAGVSASVAGGTANDLLTGADDVKATLVGNGGNDTLTAGADGSAHADSMSGDAGNDTIVFGAGLVANTATAANNDSIDGGSGIDTLSSTSTLLAGVDNTVTGAIQSISNIEQITVSDALADSITLSKIQAGIEQVNLTLGTNAAAAAYTLTFDSGVDATVVLSAELGAASTLGVTAAGTGTTDSVTVSNAKTTGTTDIFGGEVLTATGYETITLDGGSVATATQTLGTTNVNGSNGEAATLYVTGANAFTLGNYTTDNTGLQTIDAAGLTKTTGTVFTYTDGTFGTGATASITGSSGNDLITADNGNAATILGGTGNDTMVGGAAADSIDGGNGNDSINGAAGNDTLKGNEGADTIISGAGSDSIDGGAANDRIDMVTDLTSGDTVDGGAGVNTLALEATATAATGSRVSNFQVLETTVDQTMTNFLNNTGFTTVFVNGNSKTISNAYSTVATLQLDDTASTAATLSRLIDTGTDTLTVESTGTVGITTLTLDNEETLTFNSNTAAIVVGTLAAADLTSLTLSGDNDINLSNVAAITNTTLATIDATGVSGDAFVKVNASGSTVNVTFTGGTNVGGADEDSITSGAGNDTITAGTNQSVITTNNGADYVVGSDSVDTTGDDGDTISTGNGIDTVYGGLGNDTITGGSSADNLYGEEGNDTFAVGTTLADFASGEIVSGGTGTDVLSFGAAGTITYVSRTVSAVETLTLTQATVTNTQLVTLTQGTGLVTVNNILCDTATEVSTTTLNYLNTQFAEVASAALVVEAGNYYYSGTNGDLVYWDESTSAAVTIDFVGVTTQGADTVTSGNIVLTFTV